jgi:hypothetical protein
MGIYSKAVDATRAEERRIEEEKRKAKEALRNAGR